MTVLTTRMRLIKWVTGDRFKKADLAANWDAIDAAPGTHICTKGTRPTTWTTNEVGRKILETDTGLEWWWTGPGTGFTRVGPSGHLATTKKVADPPSTSSTDLAYVAISTEVTIPDGGRSVEVIVSGPGVYSTVDLARLAIYRGATQIQSWLSHGILSGSSSSQPRGVSMVLRDNPPAGPITYTLRLAAEPGYGGTATLAVTAEEPLSLTVVEI